MLSCCVTALQEVRSMIRLRKLGLRVPALYYVDADSSCLYMERVAGASLQQLLADNSRDVAGGLPVLWFASVWVYSELQQQQQQQCS
jgi:RIO-like serine/threonine protein kinase